MLSVIKMELDLPENAEFNVHKSSLLHGVIMDNISEEYAQYLHESSLKPYSQYISCDRNGLWTWNISTLSDEAYNQIIVPLSKRDIFFIKHNSLKISVLSRKIIKSDFNDLFEKNYYTSDTCRYITLEIKTPASYKLNGKYFNFPDSLLIIQNLIHKYDSFSAHTELYDEQLMNELSEKLIISSYDLRSTVFHLENTSIPSFTGRLTLKVLGGQNLVSLVNMLADFAEYSGIGIKTALGMGAVKHIRKTERKELSNERT